MEAARGSGLSSNEALSLQREDHLVDGGWRYAEVTLEIGFGRGGPSTTV